MKAARGTRTTIVIIKFCRWDQPLGWLVVVQYSNYPIVIRGACNVIFVRLISLFALSYPIVHSHFLIFHLMPYPSYFDNYIVKVIALARLYVWPPFLSTSFFPFPLRFARREYYNLVSFSFSCLNRVDVSLWTLSSLWLCLCSVGIYAFMLFKYLLLYVLWSFWKRQLILL